MMKYTRLYILFLWLIFCLPIYSSTPVSSVNAYQNGKNIVITYKLSEVSDITAYVSTDGGNTYSILNSVTGDVGEAVQIGNKSITWNVLDEYENFTYDNVCFKIDANTGSYKTFRLSSNKDFMMVFVEGGQFVMGCTDEKNNCYHNEKPAHTVTLSDYYIGETEVTQGLWKAVMGIDDKKIEKFDKIGDNYPMYKVNYFEAREFCDKLNILLKDQIPAGYKFSLPTEAQWEYAAKGGKKDNLLPYAGDSNLDNVAWHAGNSNNTLSFVKLKKPNELGIYDMLGNVMEWCLDWYNESYYSLCNNCVDPVNNVPNELIKMYRVRVLRGSAYDMPVSHLGVRYFWNEYAGLSFGFRLALIPEHIKVDLPKLDLSLEGIDCKEEGTTEYIIVDSDTTWTIIDDITYYKECYQKYLNDLSKATDKNSDVFGVGSRDYIRENLKGYENIDNWEKADWFTVTRTGNTLVVKVMPNESKESRNDGFVIRTTGGTRQHFMYIMQKGKKERAEIEKVWLEHNVWEDGVNGMRIHVKFNVDNMKGLEGRLIAYFYNDDKSGTPLNDMNGRYKTTDGKVSVGEDFVPTYDGSSWADFQIFMPYNELHIYKSGGYKLFASVWYGDECLEKSDWVYFTYNVSR